MKGKFDADSYVGGDKETYLGAEIEKVIDSDCEGIILGPNNYEGDINHIGIPHEGGSAKWRFKGRGARYFAIGIGKSMRIARIELQGAIYDASAAAQTFSEGEW